MRVTSNVPLFGLAPSGVYPAIDVTTNAVRSYRTISPLPRYPNLFILYTVQSINKIG